MRSLTAIGTSSIRYTSVVDNGATAREISLAPATSDSRYRPLRLNLGDGNGFMPISADRLIQNHNPDKLTLRLRFGATTTNPASMFIYRDATSGLTAVPANVRRIEIYLVIQPKSGAPVRYLSTSVFLRNM
ncbi:hypothetical protein D3C72_2053910 [compost metagenome]